ncbi:hypothetical protein [Lacinutrix venerupis]|uniref:Uncharacterized protein n=1 Tax=Lacinutrix venerupis TaxID=1486034 RepID=A0AAC9LLW4_9FLAO|nr:hypothetical protein [Lacinutrix venerupis]APX99749.1 hypothetical protein BWR22_05305 [Lacinutrix venerupis]
MKTDETYKLYLRDLVYLIKERHAELKLESNKDDFKAGEEFGYYAIIDLIESQADSFMLQPKDFGFNDFEKRQAEKK